MMRRTLAFLLFLLVARAETQLELCLNSLSKHIETDRTFYEAKAFHDYDYDSRIVNIVDKNILSQVLGRLNNRRVIGVNVTNKFQSNTLVVIVSSDTFYVKLLLDLLHQATWSATRQQIIVVSNDIKPKEILSYAWSKGFVDITFLQSSLLVVYQLNPFDNKLTKHKCNSTTIWFPQKMKNLLGYQVQVDVLDEPPFCNVERNASGHVIERTGAENAIFDLIVKKLNFQPQFLPRIEERSIDDYRNISFLREVNPVDLLVNIHLGKAEMVVNPRTCQFEDRAELNHTCSSTVFTTSICPLVPIIHRQKSINNTFFIAAGCIIFVILLEFLSRRCGFLRRQFWNFLVIIRLILGFAEQSQPKNRLEKIIYLCLIVASISYLARVFDQLTKLNLYKFEEVRLAEIIDIIKRNLQPQAESDITPKHMTLLATDESGFEHDIKIHQWLSRVDCLRRLSEHQNVSCLTSEVIGKLIVSITGKYSKKPKMKILYDCPWNGRLKIIMTRGSPYARPFNDILPWIRASGIVKWFIDQDIFQLHLKYNVTYASEKNELENNKIDLLFWQIFVLVGLLIATIVFFLEMFVSRFYRY